METNPQSGATAGTIGGTLLVFLLQINSAELLKTIVLAAIGATVSFSVSMVLKFVVKRISRKGAKVAQRR